MRSLLAILLLCTVSVRALAEQTFDYVAYVSGARVGEARVTVSEAQGHYLIRGRAWSVGLLEMLAGFRSWFFARGRIVDGQPFVDVYQMSQRDRSRTRELRVEGGRVTEVKDGRAKPERDAPRGLDMLSALFLPGGCAATTGFHTGRHAYVLELLSAVPTNVRGDAVYSGDALRCDYFVTDDEDDRSRATVWLAEVGGLTVPVRAEFTGGMNAGLYLATR